MRVSEFLILSSNVKNKIILKGLSESLYQRECINPSLVRACRELIKQLLDMLHCVMLLEATSYLYNKSTNILWYEVPDSRLFLLSFTTCAGNQIVYKFF